MMKYLFLFVPLLSLGQQLQSVDFISATADLAIDYAQHAVSGAAAYEFDVLRKVDTVCIDARDMQFSEVTVNGRQVEFVNSGSQLKLVSRFRKGSYTLRLRFSAHPKQTMYFVTAGNDQQIWTQGQGKYTSHWFPSFDDVNEKLIFGLSVTYDSQYEVVSNGSLETKAPANAAQTRWDYRMRSPMSSYLLMLAIGKFDKHVITAASGTPLQLYIEPGDEAKFEPTYRFSKDIFDFLETEIGVAYPWEVYRQVPVRDFLYGGMENTTATLFTRDYVCDSIAFNDRNYVNVNAHELAHQWFGDLVTARSGTHHWLQEGFATYYALLAERNVFGEDYFYSRLYDMAINLQQAAATDTVPVLNEKASSLSFYQKGGWALHVLRENVGEENFRKAVKSYLQKYQFANVTTEDFLNEVARYSSYDLKSFRKRWLESTQFPVSEAIELLRRNAFMREFFAVGEKLGQPFPEIRTEMEAVMRSQAYFPVKEQVVYAVGDIPYDEKKTLIDLAMDSRQVPVRQAVARTMTKIPPDFRARYETLLDDASYVTQEIALNALCRDFPEDRARYLDRTDGRIGMNDRNLRLLWLTLALKTPDYRTASKASYYDELLRYASAGEEASVRQDAIEKLLFIDRADKNVLPLLVNATTHHKWQFSKFGRDKIRAQLKGGNYRTFYEKLLPGLPEAEQKQLQRLLDEK